MRFLNFVAAVALAGSLAAGQEKPAEPKPENLEATIIPVKTLSGDSFNRMTKMLNVFGVRFAADDRLRTIVVYAPKDVVAQMRRVIEELDRPGSEAAIGKNIDMTMAFFGSTPATYTRTGIVIIEPPPPRVPNETPISAASTIASSMHVIELSRQ